MSAILELAQGIQNSEIGTALAESTIAFPIIEGIHLLGLSISVGLIFLTDLRLIGVLLRRVPIIDVLHHLRPWVLSGFAVTFISGFLLFWSEAATVIVSPAFSVKFLFILLGGLNALYFEFKLARLTAVVENHEVVPVGVKYAGIASIGLWTLVIIAGRLIPYLP
ncbi:MAG: hypothetical protein HZA63_08310 [Rhodocyclales bacterium]|nr:hypothetical protein [Rhodocyclales bacterium]